MSAVGLHWANWQVIRPWTCTDRDVGRIRKIKDTDRLVYNGILCTRMEKRDIVFSELHASALRAGCEGAGDRVETAVAAEVV